MKPNNIVADTVPTAQTPKSAANRKNALKSTGPKTLRGKSHSRGNSLKHGLYSKELLVSEADAPEYREVCINIKKQLQPETYLQELQADYCVVCYWRVKMATRLEHRQFVCQLQDVRPGHSEHEAPDPDAGFERWYSSREEARAAIRVLEVAITEFGGNGYFREETRNFLRCSFGPDLLLLLEEWTPPMRMDAMLLADNLVKHAQTFTKGKLPVDLSSEAKKVVVDPKQSRHMVVKLLQERMNYVKESLIITSRNTLNRERDATLGAEFNPRLLSDTHRELRRALDGYLSLKETGL
jgi:hypothetical protein